MGIKQNQIGRKAEIQTALFFQKHRYWALVIPKGINGQPFDIIARRGNVTFFVDAKHVDGEIFSFDRIEPNQLSSMRYASLIADIKDNMGFVINKGEDFYFLPYQLYLELEAEKCNGIIVTRLVKLEHILKEKDYEYNDCK